MATCILLVAATAVLARSVLPHPSALTRGPGSEPLANSSQGAIQAQTGLLYVLDVGDRFHTQILLVDTSQNSVLRTFSAGIEPDMALSPDGGRLYVASRHVDPQGHISGSFIDTYDTSSGAIEDEATNPDPVGATIPVYRTRMAMSPSGNYIYMLKVGYPTNNINADGQDWYATAFDTVKDQFLHLHVSLDDCNNAVLLPTNQDLAFDVMCTYSNSLLEVVMSDPGASPTITRMPITGYNMRVNGGWAAAIELPDEGKIVLFAKDGSLFDLGRSSGAVQTAGGTFVGVTFKGGPDIQLHQGLVSTALGTGYFGIGQTRVVPDPSGLGGYYELFDCIEETDLTKLRIEAQLCPSSRFYSMTMSGDGNVLYTVNPFTATITVIDAAAMKESAKLRGIGKTPIFAMAAP